MHLRKASLGLACAIGLLSACRGSRAVGPAAPAGAGPDIIVTAAGAPLAVFAEPAGLSSQFRITADVVFRETVGRPIRIVKLRVTVTSPSGWSRTVATDTDLAIPARGTVTHALATIVDADGPEETARWRLTATAVDQNGQSSDIMCLETDLRLPILTAASAPDAIFAGAGDIARCDSVEPEATAKLLDRIPGTVFTLGDNVYPTSSAQLFANCYEPTWGRHKWRTLATPGNHDWEQSAGMPYFNYFGPAAGPPGRGYYSQEAGSWHVVSLNSNIPAGAGSPQYEWLKADLAASRASCTLAMWHHPLFSSGPNGNSTQMRDAWRLLNRFGADVVLNGHDHDYERFAPQDADARSTPHGMRQFIVGTGGYSLYDLATPQPNSEIWENRSKGVLKLTLKSGRYDWEFVAIPGHSFRDAGSAACVSADPRL